MKKLLPAIALSLALSVGLVPCLAFAAPGEDSAPVWSADVAKALVVQASKTPKITVKRAASKALAIKKGSTYKLGAVTTAGKLSYKSSDKKVATVTSNGTVKAKNAGKVTITITAKNGSKKVSKKVPVTVLSAKKYKAVKKLSVILPHKCLRVGMVEEAVPEISPSKASNRNVTYKSSNPKVLAVSATGMVKVIKPGKAKITVTSCDNAKAKVSYVVEVEKRSLLNRSKWEARMHLPTNKQMNEYIATDRSPYIVCWPQSSENGSWVSAKSAKMERQYPEWQGSYSFGSDGPCFWAITSGVPGLCKPLASGTSFSVSEVAEGQPYEV